jgi:hypothetical protein
MGTRRPDIIGGLLDEVGTLTPDANVVPGSAQQAPVGTEDAGARTAGADIHTDKTPIRCHVCVGFPAM